MIDVKKIAKYSGLTLVMSAVITGALIIESDSYFDHTKEACELSKYLGIEHQIKAIENTPGWTAWKVYDYDNVDNPEINPDKINLADQNYELVISNRPLYTADGTKYKCIESIVVARKYNKEELELPYSKLLEVEPQQENIIKIKSNK